MKIDPTEYVRKWAREHQEPVFSELDIAKMGPASFGKKQHLSMFFTKALHLCLTSYPQLLYPFLGSTLSQKLKSYEKRTIFSRFQQKDEPYESQQIWFHSVLSQVKSCRHPHSKSLDQLALFITDNTHLLRANPNPLTKQEKIPLLLLAIIEAIPNERLTKEGILSAVDTVFNRLTVNEKLQFLEGLFDANNKYKYEKCLFAKREECFDFLLQKSAQFNLPPSQSIVLYEELFSHALSSAMQEDPLDLRHLLDYLNNPSLRVQALASIVSRQYPLKGGIEDLLPNLNNTLALLPKEELQSLTQETLKYVKDFNILPTMLKASWEKSLITQSLRETSTPSKAPNLALSPPSAKRKM